MTKESITGRTKGLIRFDNKLRTGFGGILCGVDEAGRGPLAGPVVAAAVVFSDDVYIEGIFDSKQLTHNKRDDLFGEITSCALAYGIGIVDNNEIDCLNILAATKKAMNTAISRLKIQPDIIIADGNFYSNEICRVDNYVKGDEKSFSIAAASIIAKVTRDRLMTELEKEYPHFSFSVHKGYGTRRHIDEIIEYGYTSIHRRSFKVKCLQGELF